MYNPTLSLFRNSLNIPNTQGIKYAGSKLKLISYLLPLINQLSIKTVFDGFSGTTRVSQAFAKTGFKVISNDISEWSYIFGTCYLKNKKKLSEYQELIDYLNPIKGYDGWFTQHYGGYDFTGKAIQPDGSKKPWQIHNTRKLDGIRDEIDRLSLSEVDRAVVLTSLILAMDEVDNTLGHFSSYLKEWSPRSYKTMNLKVPKIFENTQDHTVLKGDIFEAIKNIKVDFAYLDPPYGSNNEKMPPSRVRYAAYYHIWSTICKNDKPELFGKALRRKDSSDTTAGSIFEEFRKDKQGNFIAVKAIEDLIQGIDAKYIALSYSSGGKATAEELNSILNRHGSLIKILKIDYKKNVMANMRWSNKWIPEAEKPNQEFIFLIEK
ncbi:DNA adenine methylase [Candidatus Nitrosacidococcus tergens]|uniref:site-specific DNA-methyltransferase (adenine-specific) n=1 Tax=Candidatus Nitrosacidococcus tergens TaxID=553981 RepID=A0A7G1QBJ1_9GAMM|nr:DNA adenine methylase [Candidatus Nitrosacidococcus tergens]CAB1277311.1 M.SspI [Candidatus Nitrosacidococcus tergens]